MIRLIFFLQMTGYVEHMAIPLANSIPASYWSAHVGRSKFRTYVFVFLC